MSVRNLLNPESSPPTVYSAIIKGGATSVNDLLEVIIPAFDNEQIWTACPWQSQIDDEGYPVYPQDGDKCAVVFAETEQPGTAEVWVVSW